MKVLLEPTILALTLALTLPVPRVHAGSPPPASEAPIPASEPPIPASEAPIEDTKLPEFDEVQLSSGEVLVGDVTVYLPGQYLILIPLIEAPVRIDASQVVGMTLSPLPWPEVDEVLTNTGAFVRGRIDELATGESLAIVPQDQILTNDPSTTPYVPIRFAWHELRAYRYQDAVTLVGPPSDREPPDQQALDEFARAMQELAVRPKVHIERSAGAVPVVLARISNDHVHLACSEPCDDHVAPGTYRIGGEGYRPSKPFVLEASYDYTLAVEPRTIVRRNRTGLGVGGGIALLGVTALLVPVIANIPMKSAYGLWGGGGALCVLGLGVGLGISFSRTKVELTSVPLPSSTR